MMPRKLLIDRFQFSIAEVARTMLGELVEDCHGWEIRVEEGMVLIDVVEPASASQGQAGEDSEASPALQAATATGDDKAEALAAAGIRVEHDEETGVTRHIVDASKFVVTDASDLPADRILGQGQGVAAQFEKEVEAAADAEEGEEDDGDADPFWDTTGAEDVETSTSETTVDGEKPKKRATLAQLAGIMCNEGGFQKWIYASNKEEAAVKLREKCGVESRSDLDKDEAAGKKFRDLKRDYDLWLAGD